MSDRPRFVHLVYVRVPWPPRPRPPRSGGVHAALPCYRVGAHVPDPNDGDERGVSDLFSLPEPHVEFVEQGRETELVRISASEGDGHVDVRRALRVLMTDPAGNRVIYRYQPEPAPELPPEAFDPPRQDE